MASGLADAGGAHRRAAVRAGRHRRCGAPGHRPARRPGAGVVDFAARPRHVHLFGLRHHRCGGPAAGGGTAPPRRPSGGAERLAGSGRGSGARRRRLRAGTGAHRHPGRRRCCGPPQRRRLPAHLADRPAGDARHARRSGLPARAAGRQTAFCGGPGVCCGEPGARGGADLRLRPGHRRIRAVHRDRPDAGRVGVRGLDPLRGRALRRGDATRPGGHRRARRGRGRSAGADSGAAGRARRHRRRRGQDRHRRPGGAPDRPGGVDSAGPGLGRGGDRWSGADRAGSRRLRRAPRPTAGTSHDRLGAHRGWRPARCCWRR